MINISSIDDRFKFRRTILKPNLDFDHFDSLASDANRFRLLTKESLLIKRDQSQLNKTIKSFPLKLFD